ncbi:MAG: flavin reductase family protein [Bacteroidia bacterium]
MLVIDPKETATVDLHQYMLGAIAPRPIAFVSTISTEGVHNVAPYSFFNAFSSNPPIVIFSSNRKVKGNTTKDTLKNVEDTGECVINIMNYKTVRQLALASVEYPSEVSEFEKAGFTPLPSDLIKAPRVAEAIVQMECKVQEIIKLGDKGGAGNLIICEVIRLHIDESVLNEKSRIDPYKADLIARLGRHYYCHVTPESIFEISQPVDKIGMGFGKLPTHIRNSAVLTGNDLAALAAETNIPTDADCESMKLDEKVMNILAGNHQDRTLHLQTYAKELLAKGDIVNAWKVLMLEG